MINTCQVVEWCRVQGASVQPAGGRGWGSGAGLQGQDGLIKHRQDSAFYFDKAYSLSFIGFVPR